MDAVQIPCTLRDVRSFIDVFPFDLLPFSIALNCTIIINADPHTQGGSNWLAVHFRPKSWSAYYFDSYGIILLVPDIQEFIKSNCMTWDHNMRQLQGLTSNVCGKYCCLFALYMALGYTPKQFMSFFDACNPNLQVERLFGTEIAEKLLRGGWGQCCRSCL